MNTYGNDDDVERVVTLSYALFAIFRIRRSR